MRLSTIVLSAFCGVLANCCPNVQAQRENSTYPIAPNGHSNQTATQTVDLPSQTSGAVAATNSNTYDGGAAFDTVPAMMAGIVAVVAIGVA